jgi:DNA-binding SARP family transcriptional activator
VLALLLTAPGRVFSVSAIIAGIWPDQPPAGAEKAVQVYVSRLRRALPGDGASLVLTRSPGYLAAVDPAQVDAERFRILATAGRGNLGAGRAAAAAIELRDALKLWRGEAYPEFDAPFAVAERNALEELRLAAMEDRIAADLASGADPELVGELEALVSWHPWRERLWGQLMTALYRSGRQADALGAYQRARAALVEELGVEPGPDLRAVEAQVLAQDGRLLGVSESTPSAVVVGPTFIGRVAELARLLAAYDQAAAGAVERVLLTGPHGIGKTGLLAELAREASAKGVHVRYGTADGWPHPGEPLRRRHRRSRRRATAGARGGQPLRRAVRSCTDPAGGCRDLLTPTEPRCLAGTGRRRCSRSATGPARPSGTRTRRDAGGPVSVQGLAFFDVDDAPYFFGRGRLVARLVARAGGRANPRRDGCIRQRQVVGGSCWPGRGPTGGHAARQRAVADRADHTDPAGS